MENPPHIVAELVSRYSWLINEVVEYTLRHRDPALDDTEGGVLHLKGLDVLAGCARRYDPAIAPFENYVRKSLYRAFRCFPPMVSLTSDNGSGEYEEYEIEDDYAVSSTDGEDWQSVYATLDWLEDKDPRLAELVRLRGEGLTYRQIVQVLGRALGTVWRQHHQARKQVQKFFRQSGGERAWPRGRDWGQSMVDLKLLSVWENGIEGRPYARHLVADKVLDVILAREADIRSRGLWWSDDDAD